MQENVKKRIVGISVTLLLVVLLISVLGRDKLATAKSGSFEVMGTFANIVAVAADEKTAQTSVQAAIDRLHYVDRLMSDYDAESQLYKLNQNGFGKPMKIDADLFYVLSESVKYSELSEGAFDITIGAVVDLWRQAEKTSAIPTDAQIAEAKSKVGFRNLILDADSSTAEFKVEGMRLDLGGIAKGYAIDLAMNALRENGAASGMVDVGGDIRCFGSPAKKQYWRIGLQDHRKAGKMLLVLKLNDIAVATSGDYQRFALIDGERFGHIMNPQAAASAKELSSVTVIAETAIAADALATAVTVMGAERGMGLIESVDGVETMLIPNTEELTFIHTRGIVPYIDTDHDPENYTSASKVGK